MIKYCSWIYFSLGFQFTMFSWMSSYLLSCFCFSLFFGCYLSLRPVNIEWSRQNAWFSFLGIFIHLAISSSDMALNINHVLQAPKFIFLVWTSLLNSHQIYQNAYSASSNNGIWSLHLYVFKTYELSFHPLSYPSFSDPTPWNHPWLLLFSEIPHPFH